MVPYHVLRVTVTKFGKMVYEEQPMAKYKDGYAENAGSGLANQVAITLKTLKAFRKFIDRF